MAGCTACPRAFRWWHGRAVLPARAPRRPHRPPRSSRSARRGPVEEEVALAPLAVVPDVECRERSETADRTIGVVVVGHVDPQRGPAVAGVAVVEVEGLRVVGEGRDDAAGHALLLHVPGVVVEDLLTGEGPQVTIGEPGG